MSLEFSKLKFLCKLPSSSGMITAVRKTRIEKEDYETFWGIIQDYFIDEMEYDEYKGLLEMEGKPIPDDLEDGLIFESLNEYFGRSFLSSGVEFIEKEEDGTMIYRIDVST